MLNVFKQKNFKIIKKLINMVKYEDVLNTIKLKYFCDDEKYKKEVKTYNKRIEKNKKVLKK